jgi:hypothetical protein
LFKKKFKFRKSYIRKFASDNDPAVKTAGSTFVSSNRQELSIKKKMKTIKNTLIAVALFLGATAHAQERPVHEMYSMMMYNFVKYIQWPDNNTSGEFVIGVIGNQEIFNTLNAWYGGKPKGNKTYVIKKFNNATELDNCDVVFIDKSKSGEFDKVKAKVTGKGTLIITDKPGLAEKGSAINFRTIDSKLKFELNQKAVESSNLKVSGALASMAILI